MASLILDENLVSALDRACNNDDMLKKVRQKVESILREFASAKKVSYKKLRVIDIATDGGDVQPSLLGVIQSSPRPPGRSEKRHRRYISENGSCVRRLIREIMGLRPERRKDVKSSPESLLLKQIPDYLKAILDKFPKVQKQKTYEKGKGVNLISSLTQNGQLLLIALCRFDHKFDISKRASPLNSLMLEHGRDVLNYLRAESASVVECVRVTAAFYTLRLRLGLKKESTEPAHVKVENWPQPLRHEYESFLKLATGVTSPSQTLLDNARKYGFPLKKYRGRTIELITSSIAQVLSVITYEESLSVVDLISLRPTEVITEQGKGVEPRNPNTDLVRELERAKVTKDKRAGYDSELFRGYTYGVKAIASRVGYAHLIPPFKRAYHIQLDEEGRRARKDAKKRGISRSWLDRNLEDLGVEFDRVIKRRMFERSADRKVSESERSMRLCLFYPQILLMRLLGYRQEAIRQCEEGINIVILSAGTVVLHFEADEVKNGRVLHMEIKPTEGGTHERLRKALIAYAKKVLPYIRKKSGAKLGRLFFAQCDGLSGGYRGFDDAGEYTTFFKRRVRQFFPIHELELDMQDEFTAHFLRGVCADWMIIDLKMTFEEAALVLGDTVEVMLREYLDRHRVYDATPAFDKVNAARSQGHKAHGSGNSRAENIETSNDFYEILRTKDQQIDALTKSLDDLRQEFASTIKGLTAQLIMAQAQGGQLVSSSL